MSGKVHWWLTGYALLLLMALVVSFAAPCPMVPAFACEAASDAVLSTEDFNQVPAAVLEDAWNTAHAVYGNNQSRASELTRQLAGTYLAARDKDVIVIFNPGGWGWDPVTEIPGWETILAGIDTTLQGYGLSTLVIDYKRTDHSFAGTIGEIESILGVYPYKVEELVARASFLTRHLPGLRIILTGESQGAAISEKAMQKLRDNPRVYAIQSGPPFWNASHPFERSLVIDNNGIQPDAFTKGDWVVIIRANLEAILGIYHGSKGNILLYIGAPGHDYSWEYPEVCEQITSFLARYFSMS